MNVSVVYDPVFIKHDTGDHPENAKRLEAIVDHLIRTGAWDELGHVKPRAASLEELELVHTGDHISRIKRMAERGGGRIDSDTIISKDSFEVATYAAGGAIKALDTVIHGQADVSFALVRPPGHHATPKRAMGFCLFNNVAIAAMYALTKLNLSRVLILDWDVHHGNGTQEIFEHDSRVCYISLHEWPLYPGSGKFTETGVGNLVNIPLPAGCGDVEHLQVLNEIVLPATQRFKPEIILVSAGFDGHWADPLASMKLTATGYASITSLVMLLANEICAGRLVFTLEGGYSLAALAESVKAVFDALLGKIKIQDDLGPPPEYSPSDIEPLLRQIKIIHHF